MADKYLAREYIKEKIGEEYLIPLLGVWDNPDDIDFDSLPNQFVLKVNWGWGQNIIVKDKTKFDIEEAKLKLNTWVQLFSNHYYENFEWQYKNIKPKIICEQYIEQLNGDLYDYKVFCFGGEPKYIQVDFDRFGDHSRIIYDTEWKNTGYSYKDAIINKENIDKPSCFEELKSLSKKLSKDFKHVRIDYYIINNKIFIGEFTFTHQSGTCKFNDDLDNKFGELFELPKEKKIEYDNIDKDTLLEQVCELEKSSLYYRDLEGKYNRLETERIRKSFILFGYTVTKHYFNIYLFGLKIVFKIQTRPDQTRPDQTRPDQTRPE